MQQPTADASAGGTGGAADAGRDARDSGGRGGGAGYGGYEAGFYEAGPSVPLAPTDLVLQVVDEKTIELTWKDNTGGTASYECRWATSLDDWPADPNATVGPFDPDASVVLDPDAGDAGTTIGPSCRATGLTTGQTYYFWVRAVRQGLPSMEITGSKTPVAVPAQPRTILARPGGSGTVTLLWNPVVGASGYDIYWSTTDVKPETPNKQITAASTMVDVTGLDACSTYYFWVAARNDLGTGMAIKATSKAEVAPADPSDLVVQLAGTSAILTWKDNATNESDYTVYWASGTGAPKPAVGTSVSANDGGTTGANDGGTGASDAGTTMSYVIKGLVAGVSYTVWVEAKNCAGTSGAISAPANTTNLPLAPTTFAATITGASSDVLHLTWAAPDAGDAGAAPEIKGYRIYYSQTTTPPADPIIDNLPATATSADVTGLVPLATYNFWIVSFNDSGESNPPLTGKGAIGGKPATPTGTITVDSTTSKFKMKISWSAASGGGGASATQNWKLDWTIGGKAANASPVVIPVATTSYDLAAVCVDSTYVFSLKASNAAADSDAISSAPVTSFQVPGHTTDGAIKEAWIEPNGYVHFAWYAGNGSDAVGATAYNAFYNVTPDRPPTGYSTQPTTPAPAPSYYYWAHSGFLVSSPRYFWGGGVGPDGGWLLWPYTMVPGPNMTGTITFSNPAAQQVKLDWTAVSGATGYRCRWSATPTMHTGVGDANSFAMLVTTNTCTVNPVAPLTPLVSGATYWFWVEATGPAIENGGATPKGLPGAVLISGSHVAP